MNANHKHNNWPVVDCKCPYCEKLREGAKYSTEIPGTPIVDSHPDRLFGIDKITDPLIKDIRECSDKIKEHLGIVERKIVPPPGDNYYPNNIFVGNEIDKPDPAFDGKIGLIPFAYHLLPLVGLAKASSVMRKGERAGKGDNWKEIPVEEHLNHAVAHIVSYLGGRTSYHHLANACCRVLMAAHLDCKEPVPNPLEEGSKRNRTAPP